MLTYNNYLQEIRNIVSETQIAVAKAEDKLYSQGSAFVDLVLYNDYMKAHNQWQAALNELHGFLAYISKNNINLDDPLPK